MNRTLDVSRPRGYHSSVVKVKNLKGEEKDTRKVLSVFIAVCLVLSLFTGVLAPIPAIRAQGEEGSENFTYSFVGTAPNQTTTITHYTGVGGAVLAHHARQAVFDSLTSFASALSHLTRSLQRLS